MTAPTEAADYESSDDEHENKNVVSLQQAFSPAINVSSRSSSSFPVIAFNAPTAAAAAISSVVSGFVDVYTMHQKTKILGKFVEDNENRRQHELKKQRATYEERDRCRKAEHEKMKLEMGDRVHERKTKLYKLRIEVEEEQSKRKDAADALNATINGDIKKKQLELQLLQEQRKQLDEIHAAAERQRAHELEMRRYGLEELSLRIQLKTAQQL